MIYNISEPPTSSDPDHIDIWSGQNKSPQALKGLVPLSGSSV